MRKKYSKGTELTKKQKNLPEALQKLIKGKTKKKEKKSSMMVKAMKGKK